MGEVTKPNQIYTVIVADDEEEIRRGIVRKVNWNRIC